MGGSTIASLNASDVMVLVREQHTTRTSTGGKDGATFQQHELVESLLRS